MRILKLTIILLGAGLSVQAQNDLLMDPRAREKHLDELKFVLADASVEGAEFSPEGDFISFESSDKSLDMQANGCPQIYMMNIQSFSSKPEYIYTGRFTSTDAHLINRDMIVHSYDLREELTCGGGYATDGSILRLSPYEEIQVLNRAEETYHQLTNNEVYDGDLDINRDGSQIVYTSMAAGDAELWVMDIKGENAHAITEELGYEGDASFDQTGEKIVFVGTRPSSSTEKREYQELIEMNKVKLENMDLYICNADGSDVQKLTDLSATIKSPIFSPDGKYILFNSNHLNPNTGYFQIFRIGVDSKNLEQITYLGSQNLYPRFSPSGEFLLFESNRNYGNPQQSYSLVIANWVE